jgi:hypothetical protein
MKRAKKGNERVDLDVRPEVFFRNYDYTQHEDPTGATPGPGLYSGPMDKYKSVADFLSEKRKKRKNRKKRKKRKKALSFIYYIVSDDVDKMPQI